MPIFTFSHCIVCYKWHDSKNPTSDPDQKSSSSSSPRTLLKLQNRNAEICHRFGILSSRYLDLDPYLYAPEKTMMTKFGVHFDTVCDLCLPMLSSFCDLFRQWEFIQMQMNWRLNEISEVMRQSDVDVKHTEFRKQMEAKFKEKGGGPEDLNDLDDFRREFVEAALETQSEFAPRVKLERSYDEVKKTTVKKECTGSPEKTVETIPEEDAMTKSHPPPPKKISREDKDIIKIEREINETETVSKIKGHPDPHPDDDIDDDDLFEVVVTKINKRKKLSPMKKGKTTGKKHYRKRRDRDPEANEEGHENSRGRRGGTKPKPKSSKPKNSKKEKKIEMVEIDSSSSSSVSDEGGGGDNWRKKLVEAIGQITFAPAHQNNQFDSDSGHQALCEVPFCRRRLHTKDPKSGRSLKYSQLKDGGVRKFQFIFQELGIAIPGRLNPLAKKCNYCDTLLSRIRLRDDICSNQTGSSIRQLIKRQNKRMYEKIEDSKKP